MHKTLLPFILASLAALLLLSSQASPNPAQKLPSPDPAQESPQNDDQGPRTKDQGLKAGIASIDITPTHPIRLTGYSNRLDEATETIAPLHAKAIALEAADGTRSLLITADLLGFTADISSKLATRLAKSASLDPAHLALCATHTHTGPKLTGLAPTLFNGPLPPDHRAHVDAYTSRLIDALEELALAAFADLVPADLAWGQGSADFAVNRRNIVDGKWAGWGAFRNEYVDHDLPLLTVTAPDGTLRAILVNYACHCTTLTGSHTFLHGDWAGEAASLIEAAHQGAVALVAIGCGADANPEPRGDLAHVRQHGQAIATEVDRVLAAGLTPLPHTPAAELRRVDLPFEPITREQLEARAAGGLFQYSASLFIEQLDRGEDLPASLSYPIQLWTFGDDLAMFFLAGEVVADYAIRLKGEADRSRLWLNAYANESPSYIPSRRILAEGGYEADTSMAFYHQPNRYAPDLEDLIMDTMHDMLPPTFDRDWSQTKPADLIADNAPAPVSPDPDGVLTLHATAGTPYGPNIKFMPEPEWRAFGWWSDQDYVSWEIVVPDDATYEVHLTYSVADNSSGRPFLIEAASARLRSHAASTGTWENFESTPIGHFTLPAGTHQLTFKPASSFSTGGLLDLRKLALVPITPGA
jgi:hypothetical protein